SCLTARPRESPTLLSRPFPTPSSQPSPPKWMRPPARPSPARASWKLSTTPSPRSAPDLPFLRSKNLLRQNLLLRREVFFVPHAKSAPAAAEAEARGALTSSY